MLTISQVAARFGVSNRQIHELISLGYLNISSISRDKCGVKYLLSEQYLDRLDMYSLIAEAQEAKRRLPKFHSHPLDWKHLNKAVDHYQKFLQEMELNRYAPLLKASFYLFHLNHYAKSYSQTSKELYGLKKQVLRIMIEEYGPLFKVTYLLGPDRKKIWLCEDCKANARKAGIPFPEYARREYHCSKCYVQNLEKEYYSLIQFDLALEGHRFSFHLPLSAARFVKDLHLVNQAIRKTCRYNDLMFLYGRPVSRVEEQVYPLTIIVDGLKKFLIEQSTQ